SSAAIGLSGMMLMVRPSIMATAQPADFANRIVFSPPLLILAKIENGRFSRRLARRCDEMFSRNCKTSEIQRETGGVTMKLYMHPISTASRPVRLLIAETGIKCDEEIVDLLKGAHYEAPYASLNPNRMVPMLEDGDFRLTESSAILKYLADKYDLSAYPKDLKKRAKVNEVMDWLNTQFYRDFGYGLVYPQLFPHHKRRSEEAHCGTIAWGQQGAKTWLQILNDHWIGPKNQ